MRKLWTLAFAFAALITIARPAAGAGAGGGFKVVVHKDNPARGLQKAKIAMMFMKMTAKWESGAMIEPVDLPAASPVRAAFTAAVHGRDVEAVRAAWQRAIFSGRGEPPPEKASDDEVIAFIATHPGGIGYVSESAATDKVKKLDVLD
jgi:ABC-type phosphate transport system substrate-binding protein